MVEVKNNSDKPLDLTGYTLTDKRAEPQRYAFPEVTLQPGEYYVVYCSGKPELGADHASFKLSADGETVWLAKDGILSEQQIQKIYMEYIKQKNKYEYTKDIITNTERNSLNRSVLHKKYYIIIPYYEDEIVTENYSKDEIQNMIFSELYTKARSIIRTLSRCEVNARVLDSEGLIDLLYVAYNRDESDVLGTRRALQAGFEDLYTTAPDVFDKKLRLLNKKIEEEGMKLANEAISEARSDKEMLLRIREQNRQNLIFDFADSLIDENEPYIGEDVSADAKAKIKIKRRETKEGGKEDAKEKKSTRGRKSTSK